MMRHQRFRMPALTILAAVVSLGSADAQLVGEQLRRLAREAQSQVEPADEHFEPLFTRIDDARELDTLKRSKAVGGGSGGSFEALPDVPSLLVGFEYTTSTLYGGHLAVKSLRPIFRGRSGEFIGECYGVPHGKVRRVSAEKGYVVAGIVAKGGHRVDGMRVIFMRVKNGRLNPDDTYRSKWIGGHGGGAETLCAADGDPVVGIYGHKGHDLDAIGFIQVGTARAKLSAPKSGPPSTAETKMSSLAALMPRLKGHWTVTYTNNTHHIREIHENQRVNDGDELVQVNGDLLIVFPNVIERITLVEDKLFVEHFNPRSTYPDGIPEVMGVGRKEGGR